MKRFLVPLCLVLLFLAACSGSTGGASSPLPAVAVKEALLPYGEMTYQDFQAQTGTDAQLLHAGRFGAPLPEEGVEIVFEASGTDEDGLLPLLLPQDRPLRLEGRLDALVDGVAEEMTPDQLAQALSPTEGSPVPCQLLEGAGTAYYVADQYARFQLDRDGDGAGDAALEVALNSRQAVDPSCTSWLLWEEAGS